MSDQVIGGQNMKCGGDSVSGGRNDTACITGPFTNRIESAEILGFSEGITADAYRRRRTRFRACQNSIRICKTGKLGIHGTDSFFQILNDPVRQNSSKIRRDNSGSIGGDYFSKRD